MATRVLVLLLAWGLPFSARVLRAENWPGFRGPSSMGISNERDLPLEWSAQTGKNIAWKARLPGPAEGEADHNQSSPIIWKDRAFVTVARWNGKRTAAEFPEQHVACYRLTDGELLWDSLIPPGPWKLSDLRGGYAAPTPVTDGKRVYVLFGSSILAAVDFDGKIVWSKDVPDWQQFDVAIATSPILYGGQLLLLAERNGGKGTLTAYDPATGEERWVRKRSGNFAHSTPLMTEHAGRPQLVIAAAKELEGLDPVSGERIWWCKTPGDVTSPVLASGGIYTDSGRGGKGLLVDLNGEGDLSQAVRWEIPQIPEALSSPVVAGEYLYRLHSPGVLKCIRLADGKIMYEQRLPGVSVAASPFVTSEGRVYFASAGKTFVIQSGPAYELIATNDLGESTFASPAVSQGRILLKGQQHLFCIAHATDEKQQPVDIAAESEEEKWVSISDEVLKQVKPGYPGKTAGVTVDPTSGDVFMVVPDQGLWKSTDQGATFARCDGGKIGGRCETGFALNFDPAGKRLMCFMIYGGSALTTDGGKTWSASKVSHLDFGAVDWSDDGQCFLSIRHESGGLLTLSTNAGQSWKDLQKGFTHVGLFSDKVLIGSKGKGLIRSSDGGETWSNVSEITPAGSAMTLHKKLGYWTTDKGLLVSEDQGQTWQILGTAVSCVVGPLFKSDEHFVVVGKEGFFETRDRAKSWRRVAPLPDGFKVGGVGPNYAWDPVHDIFYASSMGKDTFRYRRAREK